MLESAQSLTQLIAAEVELGIPENRIVLGGFSQGAAMTLLTGLTFKGRLAALFVLSGRLPAPDTVRQVNLFYWWGIFWLADASSIPDGL